jgi:hypothetical protein
MPQPFVLPLANHMVALLIAAAVLPVLFGVCARAFFFRRDADDARRAPQAAQARAALDAAQLSPEPEERFRQPWTAQDSATPVATGAAAEAAEPAPAPTERRAVYVGRLPDARTFGTALESRWRRFIEDPRQHARYGLPRGYAPTLAPLNAALAAGATPEAVTLTVTTRAGSGEVSSAQLMQIWEQELLPGLQEQFGTEAFRRVPEER